MVCHILIGYVSLITGDNACALLNWSALLDIAISAVIVDNLQSRCQGHRRKLKVMSASITLTNQIIIYSVFEFYGVYVPI